MSYRAGVGPGLQKLGFEPGPPRITCDSCGLRWNLKEDRRPPAWFLNGKAPPGWRLSRNGDKRTDLCPRCKPLPEDPSHGR